MFKRSALLFSASIFLVGPSLKAQNQLSTQQLLGQINTITTAVPFLIITPDSRSGGMGDAGVAISPDANSIHWNPSKLAFIDKKMGAGVSYTPWLRALVPDINLAYLSFYYKLKKDQTLATSLRYFSLGDITFTDVAGNVTGQFNPSEFALDVAYARKLSDMWSAGMAGRYIHSNLTGRAVVEGQNSHPGNAFAVDISTYYRNEKVKVAEKKSTVAWGLNISNIGNKIAYTESGDRDFIPINLRTGAALTVNMDDYNNITVTGDVNKLLVPTPPARDAQGNITNGKDDDRPIVAGMIGSFNDAPGGFQEELREFNLSGGLEYWYAKQFAIRAGYFYEHATKGNRRFVSLGAGLKYKVFGLDFAYLIPTEQRHPLENTLRFSLLFDFDSKSGGEETGGDTTTN